jgi:hypothetical protein
MRWYGRTRTAKDVGLWNYPAFENAMAVVNKQNALEAFSDLLKATKAVDAAASEARDVVSLDQRLVKQLGILDGSKRFLTQAMSWAQRQHGLPDEAWDEWLSTMRQKAQDSTKIADDLAAIVRAGQNRRTAKATPLPMESEDDIPKPQVVPMPWEKPLPKRRGPVQYQSPEGQQGFFEKMKIPQSAYDKLMPVVAALRQAAAAAANPTAKESGFRDPHWQLDEIRYFFDKGKAGLNWYDDFAAALESKFGKSTGVFIDFVAATSPRASVQQNLKKAVDAFNKYFGNQEFVGFMRGHLHNLLRAAVGKELSGEKVKSFSRAMRGDPDAVTMDVWMARAFGMNRESFGPKQYAAFAEAVRELAREAGVEPRQYQAAVWTGIRGTGEGSDPISQQMESFYDRVSDYCFEAYRKAKGAKKPPPFALAKGNRKWK